MIIGQLADAATYRSLGTGLAAALGFLANTDLSSLEPGRHDLEDGLYAMISDYQTSPRETKQWEAHRKFIDVQYVVSGSELIGFAPADTLTPATDYDEAGDAIMLSGSGDFLHLAPGIFAVLYPQDAHMPGVIAESKVNVRKVVVKVPV